MEIDLAPQATSGIAMHSYKTLDVVVGAIVLIGAAVALAVVVLLLIPDRYNTLPIETFAESDPAIADAARGDVPGVVVSAPHARPDTSYLAVECVFVNPLTVPVAYYGDMSVSRHRFAGEIAPSYHLLRKTEAGWQNATPGLCGVGRGDMKVRPRQAGRFRAALGPDATPYKVGIACTWTDADGVTVSTTVWSKEFVPATP